MRNWNTRIAVEMNAGEGWLRVLGFEPIDDEDVRPVTAPLEIVGSCRAEVPLRAAS